MRVNELSAFAPAIVGAISLIVAGGSAVWIATRPPKLLRQHPRHTR